MFCKENYNKLYPGMEAENKKPSYKQSELFIAGCQAVSGIPVADISQKSGISREYIYQQKEKIEIYALSLDEPPTKAQRQIEISRSFIVRVILILMLYCRSSLEGTQRAIEDMFNVKVSIGHISGVIKEASEKARRFDDGVSLAGIKQGANDEIFQGNTPILTGIDAESSYVYLLEEASDRKAETWELYLEDRKEHGLELEVSINDGGVGLLAGIPKAYPEVEIQRDVFHAAYEIGKEISKVERRVYAFIKEEYDLKNRLSSKRIQQKVSEKLEVVIIKVKAAIESYDTINIGYTWLKELLGFSGYGIEDTTALVEYITYEMEKAAADFPGLQKECQNIRKTLPYLLSYIKRLEKAMEQSAQIHGVPKEVFQIMYQQLAFDKSTCQYKDKDNELAKMLGDRYYEIRYEFQKLLKKTKKASSLVENLNGRIRDYIDIKRIIPTSFFILLKVYFNTRCYKRSRCEERIGKSPLELFTGNSYPGFLEILGY